MAKKVFTFEALRASKGDCLLLHHGTTAKQRTVLIDGGPSRVYKPFLKPRIDAIRAKRGLGKNDTLPIDLLMISHVDDDHIKGILDMTKELISDKSAGRPQFLKPATIWHNTFNDIIGDKPDELTASIAAQWGTASLAAKVDDDDRLGHDSKLILSSVKQGRQLRNDARRLDWKVNAPFGELIMAHDGTPSKDKISNDLTFHIVGPLKADLLKLQKKHDAFLKKNNLGRTAAEAALAAFADSSVANLSSIVVLAEMEGKTILLTGDARGDKVLKGLEIQGFLKPGKTLHVDVLKSMHHGSDRNHTTGFFKRVTADHYVFTGNGKHGNPERKTLEMLFRARPAGGYVLHFCYELAKIDKEREKEHDKENKKRAKKGKPSLGPWVPAKHNVKSFLDAKKTKGIPFQINEPNSENLVRIELL